jgi:hypothetical protein
MGVFMMFALVFKNLVVQISAAEFPVAPAMTWADLAGVTPQPEIGWSYDGAVFAAPPGPSLAVLKRAKGDGFIAEAVTRIAVEVRDWDSLEQIKTVAGIWASHLASNATVAQTRAKDIYLYVRDTVPPKLAAIVDQAELDAIDPTAADPFGDGTPWPA